ncbi:MAG: hypothetical protein L6R39_005268, partial [Caloplaca ligustica]
MALAGGSNCWCGDLLPPTSSKTSDSDCSTNCNGYPDDKCGGDNSWSVLLTGLNNNVANAQDSSSNSNSDPNPDSKPSPKAAAPPSSVSTSTKSSPIAKSKPTDAAASPAQSDTSKDKPPSTITKAATVVVTAAPGQTQAVSVSAETHEPSKGPNTAGIAAGVVIGVAAVTAIAGGLFFFLRNRKRRAMEAEYHPRPAENPFETESKPPPSSHSMSDSRLEPSVMMQRRQSDVSIADNQDYSRRILK